MEKTIDSPIDLSSFEAFKETFVPFFSKIEEEYKKKNKEFDSHEWMKIERRGDGFLLEFAAQMFDGVESEVICDRDENDAYNEAKTLKSLMYTVYNYFVDPQLLPFKSYCEIEIKCDEND